MATSTAHAPAASVPTASCRSSADHLNARALQSRARSVELFHALSDETRLEVLALLRDGEQCVCDLQSMVGAAQSRLSFHLRVLRAAGLVTDRKEGRWSYYTIVPEAVAEAHDLVVALRPTPSNGRAKLPVVARCCG